MATHKGGADGVRKLGGYYGEGGREGGRRSQRLHDANGEREPDEVRVVHDEVKQAAGEIEPAIRQCRSKCIQDKTTKAELSTYPNNIHETAATKIPLVKVNLAPIVSSCRRRREIGLNHTVTAYVFFVHD